MNDEELNALILQNYDELMTMLEVFAGVVVAVDDMSDPEYIKVPRAALIRIGEEMLRMGLKYKELMEKEIAE